MLSMSAAAFIGSKSLAWRRPQEARPQPAGEEFQESEHWQFARTDSRKLNAGSHPLEPFASVVHPLGASWV